MAKADKLKQILKEEFSSYQSSIASTAQKVILGNYKQEKDVNGNDFMGLEASTAKERRSKRYGGYHKILQRTKNLMNNLKVIADFSTKSYKIAYGKYTYAEYLHDGIESKRGLKSWNILDLPNDLKPEGSKDQPIFEKFAKKLENRLLQVLQDVE